MLLAIDPGISTGWCLLSIGGIVDCGVGETWPLQCWGQVEYRAVIERPEVYARSKSRADPNDLITLAIRVGRYSERLEAMGMMVEHVLPKVWKGTIDKKIHHARARTKLTASEITIVDQALSIISIKKAHEDMLDAVCLALWKAGRLPRQGQSVVP